MKGKSLLFCEQKRSKKNFDLFGACLVHGCGLNTTKVPMAEGVTQKAPTPAGGKFFCCFFSKKAVLTFHQSTQPKERVTAFFHDL
jgi:hypothetical protein